jgi:hypothetical protein
MASAGGSGRWSVALVAVSGILLASGRFPAATAAAPAVRHTAAECRAACEDRNVPASCGWLSRVPRRCVRKALRACRASKVPGPAQCLPPGDLPGCGSNNGCPYGSLCVDAICQVVGCGSHNGIADCTGNNRCDGDKCVVSECSGVTANCPKGFHCQPADPPFSDISGSCTPDQPGVSYCTGDAGCIAPGNFNPTCMQGVCIRQARRFGRCQVDGDCLRGCRRGRAAMRMPRCDAAGMCVCPSCTDDAQCGQLLQCPQGRASTCLPSGTCVCRKPPQSATTTTTTVTTTTETTDTIPAPTTTTTLDTVCCCTFEVNDNQWHCVHSAEPSPYLCYIPWPDCCSEPYTVCQ